MGRATGSGTICTPLLRSRFGTSKGAADTRSSGNARRQVIKTFFIIEDVEDMIFELSNENEDCE
jgi:hypothetical protein